MVRTFEKDVLYPGTYSVGSAGQRRLVRFTKDDLPDGIGKDGSFSVPFLARRMKEMIGRNIQVPLSWEHQEEVGPMTAAQRKKDFAKLTCGFAASAGLHPDGFLTTNVEVDDTEDAKRMPSVRYVSPQIDMDVVDGDGNLWHGPSITHLAVTSRPVQHRQKPFRALAMSRQSIRLSISDYVPEDDTVADEKKDEKVVDESAPVVVDEGGIDVKKLLASLASFKPPIILPDDTTPENLLERLYVAVEAIAGSTAGEVAPTEPPPEPDKPKPEPDSASPMMMSLQRENKTLRQTLSTLAAADLGRRIDNLFATKRVKKPIADKLRERLKKEPVALSQTGTLDGNALLHRVEAYEEMDEDSAWGGSSLDLSRASPAPNDDDTRSRQEEAGDELAALAGAPIRRK